MGSMTRALLRLAAHPVNYWGGILLDASIAGGLLVHAMRTASSGWAMEAGLLVGGLGLYGLVEYSIHRWAYHDHRSPVTRGHRLHHIDPEALLALPFFVTAAAEMGVWAGLRLVLSDAAASVLVAALVMGFVAYSLVHHVLHHRGPSWRLVRVLRHHHHIHHRYSGVNFGVTMTLWDWVFGTHHLGAGPRGPRA